MNVGDERSRSLWMDVDVARGTPRLDRDAECDTVIVGSGIAGLSTAYELSGQGQKVIVLDRGKIGRGMTSRTTAHLSANNDDTFKTMIDRRGEKLARDFYVSQAASIWHQFSASGCWIDWFWPIGLPKTTRSLA